MNRIEVSGKTVVVGGKLGTLKKKDAKTRLEALGAIVRTAVSGTTELLFLGEGGDKDRAKAEEKGIPVYNEQQLKAALTVPVEVSGKSVVLTGQFKRIKKGDATAYLKELGSVVRGSVSGKTDLLFTGLNGGANKVKALELKLPVFDEDDLLVTIAPLRNPAPAQRITPEESSCGEEIANC